MKLAIAVLCLCAAAQAAVEHRRPNRPVPVFCPVSLGVESLELTAQAGWGLGL